MQDLIDRLQRFGSPRIALIGDFMLDRYVYGDVERISPEAAVPILKIDRQESRCGGAGNVASAMIALGVKVVCFGAVGQDGEGDELAGMLIGAGAQTSALLRLEEVSTTIKTRFIGLAQHKNVQQILRADRENSAEMPQEARTTLRAALRSELQQCQALALQDYNKGLLNDTYCREIIADAAKAGCPTVVDPARIKDYRRYRGATLITPNRFEAALATGIDIVDEDSLERAARQIMLTAEAKAVVITLDREGAYLLTDDEARRIATRPRAVYDGTGAGDEVLAMLATSLADGCGYEQAVALANIAGGLEVERFGVVAIGRDELEEEMRRLIGLRGGKIVSRPKLAEDLARRRQRGERIVFTNGCFDLLHMGHVRYLQDARELGSCLIVAINSDQSVRRLKGPSRPIIGQDERAEMLSAMECVDYVTIFQEDTPCELLELLRPDVLAKGGTTPSVVGQEIVEGYGGKVLTLQLVEGLSTTEIIDQIVNSSQGGD